jgi:hypothetical protein
MARRLCYDFNLKLRDARFRLHLATGFSPYHGGAQDLARHWSKHKCGYELDASNFDACMTGDILRWIANLRIASLHPDDATPENVRRIRNYYSGLANKVVVMDDGFVYFLDGHGNPSGQPNTMDDNCLFMLFVMCYCWKRLTKRSLADYFDNVSAAILGDDNSGTINEEVFPIFNHRAIAAFAKAELGVTFKSPDWGPRHFLELGFLSFKLAVFKTTFGRRVGFVLYDDRVSGSIVQGGHALTPDQVLVRLCSLRNVSWNDPIQRRAVKACIDLWLQENRQLYDMASWRAAMNHYRSDAWIEKLHYLRTPPATVKFSAKSQVGIGSPTTDIRRFAMSKPQKSKKGASVKASPKRPASAPKQKAKPKPQRKQDDRPIPPHPVAWDSMSSTAKAKYRMAAGQVQDNDSRAMNRYQAKMSYGDVALARAADGFSRMLEGPYRPKSAKQLPYGLSQLPRGPVYQRHGSDSGRYTAARAFMDKRSQEARVEQVSTRGLKHGAGATGLPMMSESKGQQMVAAPVAMLRSSPSPYTSNVRRVKHREGGKVHDGIEYSALERLTNVKIDTSRNSQGATLYTLKVSPGAIHSERVETYARLYQKSMMTGTVIYTGAGGTSLTGEIAGYWDPDPTDQASMGEAALRVAGNHPGCKLTHIYQHMEVPMTKACVRPVWNKDTNLGFSRLGQYDSEIRDTTQAVFTLLLSVPVSGTTIPAPTDTALILGTLSFKYTVRFYMPSIDESVLGDMELNVNTGYASGDTTSSNFGWTSTTSYIVWAFTNNPIPEQDLNSFFTANEDYSMAGTMSEAQSWFDLTSAQATAWGNTVTCAGVAINPPWRGNVGWVLASASVAQLVTINVATTFAITSKATGVFTVAIVNPDDTTGIPAVLALNMNDNSVSWNVSGTGKCTQGLATAIIQTNVCVAGGTSSPYTASVTIAVDPSAFRYNASRIAIMCGWSDSAATLSAQSWTGVGKFIQIITHAMTQDQQVSWGIPAYAPRTLLSSGAIAPLQLSDIGAMRQEQSDDSELGFGLGGLAHESKLSRVKLYEEFEKAGGVEAYTKKRVEAARRRATEQAEKAVADKAFETAKRAAFGQDAEQKFADITAMFADMYLESAGIPVDQKAVAARIERKLAQHRESLGEDLTLAKIKHREERKSESAPKKVRLASPVTLLSPQVATQKAAPVDPPPTVKGTTTSLEKAPDHRNSVQGDTTTDDETEATIVLPLSAEEKALLERRRREL